MDFEAIWRVYNACGDGMSSQEQLELLTSVWLVVAANARTEALSVPDGFPNERARQVDQLRQMADGIAADEPDIELERLFLEKDLEGALRHVKERVEKPGKPDGSST